MGFWNRFWYNIDETSVKKAVDAIVLEIDTTPMKVLESSGINNKPVKFNGLYYSWSVVYNKPTDTYHFYIETDVDLCSWDRKYKYGVHKSDLYSLFIEICKHKLP